MGEDDYDPPIILGRPFLSTVKAIIYIGTGEVHMHFPSEKVRRYFTVGYFKRKQKNPQAHGYRCSLHPGVFQSIDFPQGT